MQIDPERVEQSGWPCGALERGRPPLKKASFMYFVSIHLFVIKSYTLYNQIKNGHLQ